MAERKNLCGIQIKLLREKVGLSLEELSQKVCQQGVVMVPDRIKDIEDGKTDIWDIEIVAFANALGCGLSELFVGLL